MVYKKERAKGIQSEIVLYPEEFTEKKTFGGLRFLCKGKMTVGIAVKQELAFGLVGHKMDKKMALDYICSMDFTKKPIKKVMQWIALRLEHHKIKLNKL
ncbi:MAG: hypothetical protein HRT68_17080 [Flavobacteriaceae bacterium]|nr:hypothetical protein [Flavobacteriaceae bacterium]